MGGLTSLQVCMDSSDWLQGTADEDTGIMDSSSSSISGDMLACSSRVLPLMQQERRLMRPQHEQALKCPRCDSTHTKFCYYNNYSLSQPRYFCKTCRRYWTKGGTLRNIPVGGGCRKNKKKVNNPSKKSNDHHQPIINHPGSSSSSSQSPTYLQLSFPQSKYNGNIAMLENSRPIDFMESKYEALVGSTSRNHDSMGINNGDLGILAPYNFHALSSPFGMSLDGINCTGPFMDNCQRLMLPFEDQNAVDMKPNGKLLSLEWKDQGCSDAGIMDSFGYLSGLGSWTGLMNGYGTSTTNPLV